MCNVTLNFHSGTPQECASTLSIIESLTTTVGNKETSGEMRVKTKVSERSGAIALRDYGGWRAAMTEGGDVGCSTADDHRDEVRRPMRRWRRMGF